MLLDVIESVHSQNEYSCPCCGNMDVIESFFNGCKYCGSQFNFEDFQSKVNQVRFRDTAMVTFHDVNYALLYIKPLSLLWGIRRFGISYCPIHYALLWKSAALRSI